jgi:Zn-dependent protease
MDNLEISNTGVFSDEEVLAEINKSDTGKKNWMKNLVIFAITLFIFVRIGLIKNNATDIVILVIVLLLHEMGHFIGMRLFGYRNVGMFFIPFFGAAVSGEGRNVASYKKVIVTLLGPVPGLVLGLVCLIACGRNEYGRRLAIMFLSINLFNLLPIFPLDGGRLLHQVLFCRNRYVEMVFTILAGILLIGLGLLGQLWILGLLGLFLIVSVRTSFKVAQVCNDCKGLVTEEAASDGEKIPPEAGLQIIRKLRERFKEKVNVKTVADLTRQVWERVQTRPPGTPATVGLLGVYISSIFVTILALAVIAAVSSSKNYAERKFVDYRTEDGRTAKKEQIYIFGKLSKESELNVDGSVYHGRTVSYYPNGAILAEGRWEEGKRDGEWNEYDNEGKVTAITVFDKGRFVVRRESDGDQWILMDLDKLPQEIRERYLKQAIGPPIGPLSQKADGGNPGKITNKDN